MIRVSCVFQSCFFKGSASLEDGFTILLLYNSKNIQVCRFRLLNALNTNIPITDALLVIKDLLNNDTTLQDRTNMLPDQILELLEFLLRTTFFIFNGEFH